MVEYKVSPQVEAEIEKLSWAEAPKMVTKIPGPKTKRLLEKELANEINIRIFPNALQVAWSAAFGATVKDPDGNVFIDLTGGVAVNNTGHSHPEVVKVIKKECGTLMHVPDATNSHRQKLGEKISKMAPGKLKGNVKAAYGLSGSSAVEMAIKFARASSGKALILGFDGAYHGSLGNTLALTTSPVFRSRYRPFAPFVRQVGPYPYCYRCPLNLKYPDCNLQCAQYLEWMISSPYSGMDVENVAALIIEPMQGEGGYVPTPPGYLEHIRKMCDKLGILYIDDEVQVGMGRTGKMFCVEHYGVEPDIITLGKALGGDLPFSAVVARKDALKNLDPFSHVLTAVGNATSCAVACTNIDLLQGGIIDRAAELGDYVMARLEEIQKEREIIGDVRGLGLGIAVELVKDRETKEPIAGDKFGWILWTLRDRGVLILPCGRFDNVLRFIPPLVLTKAHADKALEIMSEVFKEAEAM